MVYYYFYPELVVLTVFVIIDTIVVQQLYKQIKKDDSRRWKYLRVWLFVCFDIGLFLVILSDIQANSPLQKPNFDLLYYTGVYFQFSASTISAYLTMELANLHKNKESNPRILYGTLAFLWITAAATEIYWLIYATSFARFVRQVVQAIHIVLLSVIMFVYGGSLLWQLKKSQVLSKKTTALRKLSSMLIVGGSLGLGVMIIEFGFSSNGEVAVWGAFALAISLNILFIGVLGPGIVVTPGKQIRIRPFWKRNINELSPLKRENGDSLSDAFSTPSTDPEMDNDMNTASTAFSSQSLSQSTVPTPTPSESNSRIEMDPGSIEMDTIERGEKPVDYNKGSLDEKKQEEIAEKLRRFTQDSETKEITLQTPGNDSVLNESQLAIVVE